MQGYHQPKTKNKHAVENWCFLHKFGEQFRVKTFLFAENTFIANFLPNFRCDDFSLKKSVFSEM